MSEQHIGPRERAYLAAKEAQRKAAEAAAKKPAGKGEKAPNLPAEERSDP